jgi:hypothetical protein
VFGIQTWLVLAVALSLGVILFSWLGLRGRSGVYRLLAALGVLCLVWGVLPSFGGGGMNQYLVIGAVIAFGFLVLSDSTGDGSRW